MKLIKTYHNTIKLFCKSSITQADQPIAEIKPILTKPPQKERRPIGLCEGEFVVPDDFNDPLPGEIIKLFENP